MTERNKVLKRIIDKIAVEQQYQNCKVDIKEFSSGGANYTSNLYEIKILALNKPDLYIFAKETVTTENFRKETKVDSINNEIFYFTKLAKDFERLELKHNIPQQHRLKVPKFYGCDLTYLKEILLFENLGAQGYQSFDRHKTADWEYASAAVKELAKFNALSIAYIKENPERFNEYSKSNNTAEFIAVIYTTMLTKSITHALEATREENKDKMNKHFSSIDISESFKKFLSIIRRPTLIHTDYRPNNLMHKINDDGIYDIVIIDFQTLGIGCAVVDILYFIFTCTDEEFRRKHFDELFQYYYKQLGLALNRLNIDVDAVYNKEDFEYESKELMLFGLYTSIFVLPFITVDTNDAPEIKDVNDLTIKGNSIYVERLNGVINDYVRWNLL